MGNSFAIRFHYHISSGNLSSLKRCNISPVPSTHYSSLTIIPELRLIIILNFGVICHTIMLSILKPFPSNHHHLLHILRVGSAEFTIGVMSWAVIWSILRRLVEWRLMCMGIIPSLLWRPRSHIDRLWHPVPFHKIIMDYSIHVVIKKNEEVVFESTKSALEMKEKHIPQKELQTDSEPLPLLKEGTLYHLTTAVDVICFL